MIKKRMLSFFILFIGIIILFELLFQYQNIMPYLLPFLIFGIIFLLEKFILEKNYIVYLSYNLLVIGILIGQFLLSKGSGVFYESIFHTVQIPFTFLIFYAYKEKKKVLFAFSLSIVVIAAMCNFLYRDDVAHYRMYGNNNTLKSKNILIPQIKVKNKYGIDSVIVLEKGKYVIDFWSLYCPVCRAEMPYIDSIKRKDSSFRIVSLLTAYKKESQKEFSLLLSLDNSYPSFHFYDSTIINNLKIDAFPQYYVVDNNQVVFKGSVVEVVNFYYEK
jgi:thiol-disulfide isomerase/thioredoxin